MEELISKRVAINAIQKCKYKVSRFSKKETNLIRDRAIDTCCYAIEDLPPVQLEIIRCQECKSWDMYGNMYQGFCPNMERITMDIDFCAWAERREDNHETD